MLREHNDSIKLLSKQKVKMDVIKQQAQSVLKDLKSLKSPSNFDAFDISDFHNSKVETKVDISNEQM